MWNRHIWNEFLNMDKEMEDVLVNLFDYTPRRHDRHKMIENKKDSKDVAEYRPRFRRAMADMCETDKEVMVTAELPGVDKKDIDINLTEDAIEIKVERKHEKADKKKNTYQYSHAGFYRCMPLPDGLKTNAANASYNNGILEIKIPKDEQKKPKVKKLEVK